MNGARDQLFSDSALSRQEDLRIGTGDPTDLLPELDHRGAAADQFAVDVRTHNFDLRVQVLDQGVEPQLVYLEEISA